MGEMVKAKLLRPVTDYAKVYGWDDRYSPTLLDLNKFSSDGAEFGSGDLYGLSQMGEIVGVFYNKDKVPTPPTTLDEFEASLQEAKDAGETPIMFGNLEKWPGIHNFETRARADRRQAGDPRLRVRQGGRLVRHPGVHRPARRRSRTGSTRATSTRTSTARTTTRRGRHFAKGKSRYLIAGTWVTADLAKQMGDKVGFMLMPGKDPNAPVSLGGEDLPWTITLDGQEPRRGGGLHRLPHRRQRGQGARRHGQPAGDEGRSRRPTGGLSAEVADAWQKLNEADGVIPYLDYTTPTFYDDISGAIQELLARQAGPGGVHRGRAGGVRQVGGVR